MTLAGLPAEVIGSLIVVGSETSALRGRVVLKEERAVLDVLEAVAGGWGGPWWWGYPYPYRGYGYYPYYGGSPGYGSSGYGSR